MANKAGMIHPQRVQPYRQYTPNEFSNQDGMPHIMSVNKQFGGNKCNIFCFNNIKNSLIAFFRQSKWFSRAETMGRCESTRKQILLYRRKY